MKKISLEAVIVGITLLVALVCAVSALSFRNRCVAFEAGIAAERAEARNRHSQMRTEIIESAGVNNQYRADVLRAFDRVVVTRQGSTNEVLRAISEANPSISTETYTRVQRTIERRRGEFHNTQTSLTDRGREYRTYVNSVPGAWWNTFFHFPRINIDEETRIVTTHETENAFRPGGHDAPITLPSI